MADPIKALSYRKEIDGIRAIAVISVVLYHAGIKLVPGGYVGVDIFFVISGYLITALLHREWNLTGKIDLLAFYARRVRRILPAVWVLTACVLVAAFFLLSPIGGQQQAVSRSAIASLIFAANIYFQRNTSGYFDGPSEELPLLHLWSLSVEEQFYFIWPLLLIVLLRFKPVWLKPTLIASALISFAICEFWILTSPSWAFFQMPARFWELAVGGMIALSLPSVNSNAAFHSGKTATAGILLTVIAIVFPFAGTHFPGAGALPAVVGTGLLLYAIHNSTDIGIVGQFLASRIMVFFGLISYSLYLWHWPLLAFATATDIKPPSVGIKILLCLVATLLAWLSYIFIETPFRRFKFKTSGKKIILAASAFSLGLAASAAFFGYQAKNIDISKELARQLTQEDWPANTETCHLGMRSKEVLLPKKECYSIPSQRPDVIIWGDSHALAWLPFANSLGKAHNQSVVGFTFDLCPPAMGYINHIADFPDHFTRCQEFDEAAIDFILRENPETVILSARWLLYFSSTPESYLEKDTSATPEKIISTKISFKKAMSRTLKDLTNDKHSIRKIILIGPTPQIRNFAARCIITRKTAECVLPRSEFDSHAKEAQEFLLELADQYSNVEYIDPTDYFCNKTECAVLKNDHSLYTDDNHISKTAAVNFAKYYVVQKK